MKTITSTDHLPQLKEDLQRVRQESLQASRQDDFRAVARLTQEAARLNRLIYSEENFVDLSPKTLAVVDALANLEDAGHFEFPDELSASSNDVLELEPREEAA